MYVLYLGLIGFNSAAVHSTFFDFWIFFNVIFVYLSFVYTLLQSNIYGDLEVE